MTTSVAPFGQRRAGEAPFGPESFGPDEADADPGSGVGPGVAGTSDEAAAAGLTGALRGYDPTAGVANLQTALRDGSIRPGLDPTSPNLIASRDGVDPRPLPRPPVVPDGPPVAPQPIPYTPSPPREGPQPIVSAPRPLPHAVTGSIRFR